MQPMPGILVLLVLPPFTEKRAEPDGKRIIRDCHGSVQAFLDLPWSELAACQDKSECQQLINRHQHLANIEIYDKFSYHQRGWQKWTSCCPSCFEYTVKIPPKVFDKSFADFTPSFAFKQYIFHALPLLDSKSGKLVPRPVCLAVLTVSTTQERDRMNELFQYRSADELQDGDCFRTFVPRRPDDLPADCSFWFLVRTENEGGHPSQAISLIHKGCLDPYFDDDDESSTSEVEAKEQTGERLVLAARNAAGYRKPEPARAPAKLETAMKRLKVKNTCIRTNREKGPFGHAGGMTMSDGK